MSTEQPGYVVKRFFRELVTEIYQVTWALYKIMIPTLLVIKVLEELGALVYLGWLLSPLMSFVGLPDSMGIVWATTMATNLYAGMVVFFDLAQSETLTVAQVTVLSTLLLVSHGLPVEARIAQKAGIKLSVTLLIRIGGALLFGALMHYIYSAGGFLEQANELVWQPQPVKPGLSAWLLAQAESLLWIFVVISVLLTALKLLRVLGVERLLGIFLSPFLKLMGIGRQATTITLVGMTLGLAFGGGLLIAEAGKGHIPRRDIFASLTMLGLCHSLIEDSLLMLLLGAHVSGVIWLRLAFTLLAMAIVGRWLRHCSDDFVQRTLFNRHGSPPE